MYHRNIPNSGPCTLLLHSVFLLAVLLLTASAATAQVNWNPPCNRVTIRNASNCTFNGTINTTPPGLIPTAPIPPGAINTYPMPAGSVITGVTTPYLNTYPFNPLGLGTWWVNAVTMGPPDCCVDLIADINTCTIRIANPLPPYMCHD